VFRTNSRNELIVSCRLRVTVDYSPQQVHDGSCAINRLRWLRGEKQLQLFLLDWCVGGEDLFDSVVVVFHDNGVAVVDGGCRFVFATLGFLADDAPGIRWFLFKCTPVILCTPGVHEGLIGWIKVGFAGFAGVVIMDVFQLAHSWNWKN
jgi:hypothetical protein